MREPPVRVTSVGPHSGAGATSDATAIVRWASQSANGGGWIVAAGNRATSPRVPVTIGLALLTGLLIALVDSSAGWDSTGITAGALLLAGGGVAYLGRGRPWLWMLLVGLPTPAIEIA